MELPLNLKKANTFIDATFGLRGLVGPKERATKIISRLGRSGRLVMTTAHNFTDGGSRAGCIVIHSPRSRREARRWIAERGFGEQIDGVGKIDKSQHLVTRDLDSMKGPETALSSQQNGQFGRV